MSEQLKIRNAALSDVDLIYNWSNDELVRKQSHTSNSISYDTHCEWFKNKLTDSNSLIFIIESQGTPASMIRFDISNEMATIGISIDKNFRGKGLAVLAINMGVAKYFDSHSFPILASIKCENISSIKSFKKAGFTCFKEEEINDIKCVVYQLEKATNE